jgi:hypothetical protein
MIPTSDWFWMGTPGHFCAADSCVYHMATKVGPWLVSTVGWYLPRHETNVRVPERIGADRLFETMVFDAEECSCGNEMCEGFRPGNLTEIDMLPANDARTARANHMKLCEKYSQIEPEAGEQKEG